MDHTQILQWLGDRMYEGIYIVDRQRRIIYWNTGAEDIAGYCYQEVMGKRCWDNLLRHVDDQHRELCRGWCPLVATMQDGQEREAAVYLHHKAGHRVPIKVRVVPIRDAANTIIGAIEIFCKNADQSSRNMSEDTTVALHPLTNVANCFFMENHLKARLAELHKNYRPFSLIRVSIASIEHIAQTYGPAVRDDVIKMVANTLAQNAGTSSITGHWGAADFLIVVNGTQQDTLATLIDKLNFLVDQSFLIIEGQVVRTKVSLKIVTAHLDDTFETLLMRSGSSSSDLVAQP